VFERAWNIGNKVVRAVHGAHATLPDALLDAIAPAPDALD